MTSTDMPPNIADLDGLALMQELLAGRLPPPPIAKLMGFDLVEVGPGRAVFSCMPRREHYNPLGTVHGGLAGTLLDSAMGCAVHSAMQKGQSYTTLEYKVNLVRAMTESTGVVRVEGRVVHLGRRMATAEGRIIDAAGKFYAHGTTTCLVMGG